jgi:hypothetical protein
MEPIEQSSQFGSELALLIALATALAAIIVSPLINWLVMRSQERGLNKRLNAQRHRQLADQFRLSAATLLSKTNEQASQMLMIQKYGRATLNESAGQFDAWMHRVDELSLDTSRIGQSIHLLIDRDSEDGKALILEMIQLSNSVDRTINPKFRPEFPEEPIFSNLCSEEDIGEALTNVSAAADRILKQLEKLPE